MKQQLSLFIFFALAIAAGAELTDQQKGERLFSLQVRGILESKCFACHGENPKKVKGGLNMTEGHPKKTATKIFDHI